MISASLAVEGHAHGLGLPGHHHPAYHMTYPEPWRGAPPQPPPKPTSAAAAASSAAEFLRPAPKQFGNTRYNGTPSSTTTLNGTRLVPQTSNSPRSSGKYPSPPCNSTTPGPVNLTQQQQIKDEAAAAAAHADDRQAHSPQQSQLTSAYSPGTAAAVAAAAYSRLYPAPPGFAGLPYQSALPGHYGGLYPTPYTPIIRTNFVQPPPLSPLETYSPPTHQGHVKPGQSVLRDKRSIIGPVGPGFKVPSGKEGSLKHRILTRPPGENTAIHGSVSRKRMSSSALSPPATPTKPALNTNNNTVPGNFTKGSLIQLASGELRRVEDMRTEDFVLSAEKCPELRLAESTVVRIEENPITGTSKITLSYNQNRTQVDFEATLEHPFFVFGQGWASCNPERTLQCYGLKVHRLQVGDILVSLTPREPTTTSNSSSSNSSNNNKSSTITTTATTTAMTARQVSRTSVTVNTMHQLDKALLPPPPPAPASTRSATQEPLDASTAGSRKRRWSAPEQICDEDEQVTRRHKE